MADRARAVIGTATAALLAVAYLLAQPPSRDLAAHLFDAGLFGQIGWAPWDTLWYAGHSPLAYSILFPAIAHLLSPQLAASVAAVGTAAVLERLVHRHVGPPATPVALLLGGATAIDLYTGRLALAAGALPAAAAILALDHGGRRGAAAAVALAVLAALLSPLAGLFCALAAGGVALGAAIARRSARAGGPGALVAVSALLVIGALTLGFGQPGVEPFGLGTLLPALAVCAAAALLLDRSRVRLRATVALTGAVTLAAWFIPSALGANVARLTTLCAAGLGALVAAERGWRRPLQALVLVPLLYIGWQAPVADVLATAGDPAVHAAYYRPLLRFLSRRWAQAGPFRVEIPFTASHWEAYWVARRFPLARGWERQLDEADNPLFYRAGLTAAAYARWLERDGVRYVALPDAALDPSARAEAQIIRAHPGFLRPVARIRHWTVDEVVPAPGLASGAVTVTAIGPDRVALLARRPGVALVRLRFTPFWQLRGAAGCVGPAPGGMTLVRLRRAGPSRLVAAFSLARVATGAPRCTT